MGLFGCCRDVLFTSLTWPLTLHHVTSHYLLRPGRASKQPLQGPPSQRHPRLPPARFSTSRITASPPPTPQCLENHQECVWLTQRCLSNESHTSKWSTMAILRPCSTPIVPWRRTIKRSRSYAPSVHAYICADVEHRMASLTFSKSVDTNPFLMLAIKATISSACPSSKTSKIWSSTIMSAQLMVLWRLWMWVRSTRRLWRPTSRCHETFYCSTHAKLLEISWSWKQTIAWLFIRQHA